MGFTKLQNGISYIIIMFPVNKWFSFGLLEIFMIYDICMSMKLVLIHTFSIGFSHMEILQSKKVSYCNLITNYI